jgi:hypothetical protein
MSVATELELESELESELGSVGELEQELELAHELVGEFELEHEQEAEHEAFFNSLAAMADRTGRAQGLRRIALAAARAALKNQARPWPVVEGEGEFEATELEGALGELEALPELEHESSAAELSRLYELMEHEGHAAAEAANEQEAAEHFLPLIGLAAKLVLPKLAGIAAKKLGGSVVRKVGGKLIGKAGGQLLRRVAPRMVRRVTPQLTRGLANVTRTLYRNRTTRPLIHALPGIARTTVARLAGQIARGRPLTAQGALRTLAQQTARILSNPRGLARTYRRSLALDRRYHRRTRRVLGQPAGTPVRAARSVGQVSANGLGAGPQWTPSVPNGSVMYGQPVNQLGGTWDPLSVGARGFICQPVAGPPAVVRTCTNCGR